MATSTHKCFRCGPHIEDGDSTTSTIDELESLAATSSEDGSEVFFASGYSAREIAFKHAQEMSGRVYVNDVSRKIRRRNMTVPVSYAVSRGPVYTVCGADDLHDGIHRVYWRPL